MQISGFPSHEGYGSAPSQAPARSQSPVSQETSSRATSTSRFTAAASQSTNTSLSLTTAEGDKVVLSLASSSTAAVAAEGVDYASIRTQRSEVKIQVEGDLNPKELADIQKLAEIVSGAATDALKGDTGGAARQLTQANGLESIQNFAFSLNRQVDYRFNYEESSSAVAAAPTETAKPAVADDSGSTRGLRRPRPREHEGFQRPGRFDGIQPDSDDASIGRPERLRGHRRHDDGFGADRYARQ